VARAPLRVQERPDTSGGPPVRFPIWFEPLANGQTPMCAALNHASNILASFLVEHPDCYPPLVINLTDGEANDGNPEAPAAGLRQLSSTDGGVLLFNLHVSERAGEATEFPDHEAQLSDKYARLLFRMLNTCRRPMCGQKPAAASGPTYGGGWCSTCGTTAGRTCR